jgi:hypothetical protein
VIGRPVPFRSHGGVVAEEAGEVLLLGVLDFSFIVGHF